jgi:hypothetical protein
MKLLVTAYVRSSLNLSALMMEAIHSSGTSVPTRSIRHHVFVVASVKTSHFAIFLLAERK